MIDAATFNTYPLQKQSSFIEQYGHYIASRSIYNKSEINLYSVNEFWAERHHNIHTNELEQIITMNYAEVLAQYPELEDKLKPPRRY